MIFSVFSNVQNLGHFAKDLFKRVVFPGVVMLYIKITAIFVVILHYQSRHIV